MRCWRRAGGVQVERSGSWGWGGSQQGGRSPDSPRSGLGGLAVVSIPGLGQGCSWQRVQFLMGGVGDESLGLCPLLGKSGLDRASHPQLWYKACWGLSRVAGQSPQRFPYCRGPRVSWCIGLGETARARKSGNAGLLAARPPNQATYAPFKCPSEFSDEIAGVPH